MSVWRNEHGGDGSKVDGVQDREFDLDTYKSVLYFTSDSFDFVEETRLESTDG